MRSHIAKALQARCKAIRNAVNRYNEAAVNMTPSRPTLDWSKVSHYTFLEEFELLRGSRQDMQERRWTDAVVRETMKQDLRIKRAREEIIRCNIEIRRVHTAILDEHAHFERCLADLEDKRNPIHGAVSDFVNLRRTMNYHILYNLEETFVLEGFTGDRTCGVRKGMNSSVDSHGSTHSDLTPIPPSARQELMLDERQDDDVGADLGETDEEQGRDVIGLVDYISDLPTISP